MLAKPAALFSKVNIPPFSYLFSYLYLFSAENLELWEKALVDRKYIVNIIYRNLSRSYQKEWSIRLNH